MAFGLTTLKKPIKENHEASAANASRQEEKHA
jgi:hypothetical protein